MTCVDLSYQTGRSPLAWAGSVTRAKCAMPLDGSQDFPIVTDANPAIAPKTVAMLATLHLYILLGI